MIAPEGRKALLVAVLLFLLLFVHFQLDLVGDVDLSKPEKQEPEPGRDADRNQNEQEVATIHAARLHSTPLKLRSRPPRLEELVSNDTIVGNVEWLLDFAIIGHAKCGTSSTVRWLNSTQSIYIDGREIHNLVQNKPHLVVKHFHHVVSSHASQQANISKIGMKCPRDIDSMFSLGNYQKYFGSTKFIVLLRHPILWFQSFYNYRSLEMEQPLPPPSSMIGSCWKDDTVEYACGVNTPCKHPSNLCTQRARFHHFISRLGLTPMNTVREWDLLDHHNMTIAPTSQPVMFIELNQYESIDGKREVLRRDVQDFLGVDYLPPIPLGEKEVHPNQQIDICQDEFKPLRQVLLHHGQRSSQWIQEYLLKSDRAIVSSRDYFIQLLDKWNVDPCEG